MKVYYKETGKEFQLLNDVEAISQLLDGDTSFVEDPNIDPETGLYPHVSGSRLEMFSSKLTEKRKEDT